MATDSDTTMTTTAATGYQAPNVHIHSTDDEALRRISRNDPDVAGLYVRFKRVDMNMEWVDRIGSAISNSMHLRKLKIIYWYRSDATCRNDKELLELFFRHLAHNRSIEHLTVDSINHSAVDIFAILAPFFEQNHNLRCIETVGRCFSMRSFISALKRPNTNRLERIDLSSNQIGDDDLTDLINALTVMPGLNILSELNLGFNRIENEGCKKLGELLKNTSSGILRLDLQHNYFVDDDGIGFLVGGLFESAIIKSLNLSSQRKLSAESWRMLSAYLRSPNCLLETLYLGAESHIDDEGAFYLGNAFAVNNTLQCMNFECNYTISSFGWQEISRCLRPHSALEEIVLINCSIEDDGAFVLFSALATSSSLKKLKISENESITEFGWEVCLPFLHASDAPLEELDFSFNNINDIGANMLAELVADMKSTVRVLDVTSISITTDGVGIFARIMQPGSSSQLQDLRMGPRDGGDLNDDVAKCFAAALANNSSLKMLELSGIDISIAGYSALAEVLCDKTNSIASIANSNHTLCSFYCDKSLHPVLASLLRMNANENKEVVVRHKIVTQYLSDVDTAGRFFASMTESILPTAMACIGSDRHGYSALFSVVRNVLLKSCYIVSN